MEDQIVLIFTLTVILISAYIYYQGYSSDLIRITSTVDGNTYIVSNLPDKVEAANMLAMIRVRMEKLANHMYEKYPDDIRVTRLRQRFDESKVVETSKSEKFTSYTINKGAKMVLCLRARDAQEKLEQENTMMFVSLHEMAHIMTKAVGHDADEFWSNFKFILQNAVEIGVYTNIDYK